MKRADVILQLFPVVIVFRAQRTKVALSRSHRFIAGVIFDCVTLESYFALKLLVALEADVRLVHHLNVFAKVSFRYFNPTHVA